MRLTIQSVKKQEINKEIIEMSVILIMITDIKTVIEIEMKIKIVIVIEIQIINMINKQVEFNLDQRLPSSKRILKKFNTKINAKNISKKAKNCNKMNNKLVYK